MLETALMQGNSELLGSRVREVRIETFGEKGTAALSQAMNIPAQTWEHFENGVTIPALIILAFIEITGVEPHWLLTGDGDRFRLPTDNSVRRASR
jgi:hypothetical protein